MRLAAICLLAALPASALAQQAVVAPDLQLATSESITLRWETDLSANAEVEWGPTAALGTTVSGESWASLGGTTLHRVTLEGLTPGATVHYRARSGAWSSPVNSIVVPEAAPETVRLIAVSDMQRDGANPDVFRDVIAGGVLPWVTNEVGLDLPNAVQAMLVPGDLVANGWSYGEWEEQFFTPAAPLMARVPTYPVPGNHESDTPYFFDYFDLPDNGTAGFEEHWWWHDIGRVRVIGLDSNAPYLVEDQLSWLDGVLADTCEDTSVDFVIAQLHHPYLSELWTPGENLWTGSVVSRLEDWSTECVKPSVHLFGHTHGYSRGQSRDHTHLWINVATAGGAIDYWGEWPQRDYDEFVVTQDEWGFVFLEAEAGPDPSLRVRRVSRGNRDVVRDNEVTDDMTVRTVGQAPATPVALAPAADTTPSPEEATFVASAFFDPDGDAHGATQWQIAPGCDGFDAPVVDRWIQHRNEFGGVDLQAGDDLTDLFLIDGLDSESPYCWRVRYRDTTLVWSEWSKPMAFTTARASFTDNLLSNPGAEEGVTGWEVVEGVFESVEAGECDAGQPRSGEHMFVVGGVCDTSEFAVATQSVAVGLWRADIDAGRATARLGGWMSDWNGADEPAMQLVFLDEEGAELGRGQRLAMSKPSWTRFTDDALVPVGTARMTVRLEGTRYAGTDNDSYIDDLELRLRFSSEEPGDDDDVANDDDAADDDDDDGFNGEGCGCAAPGSKPGGAWGLLVFGGWLAVRRRP